MTHVLGRINEYAERAYANGYRVFVTRIAAGQYECSIRHANLHITPATVRRLARRSEGWTE